MEERLQKIMANSGVASRRKCEELILSGRVTVNGKVAGVLGTKVNPQKDIIKVDGRKITAEKRKIYIMLNKPRGYVTTALDPEGRKKVTDLVKDLDGRIFPVGRLDMDTEGLLLLTNDGELAYRMTHPKFKVKKTYHVKIEGLPTEENLIRLAEGIELEDGMTAPARLTVLRTEKDKTLVEITIREGRKRQVRRMFDQIGHRVIHLKRVRFGPLSLGRLKKGSFRELTPRELASLPFT